MSEAGTKVAAIELQQGRSCHMQSLVGSTLYVMGGFDGYGPMDSIEKIDLADENP